MKLKSTKASVAIVMALYAFSLFSYVIPIKNSSNELSSVIQLIQKLQHSSVTELEDFQTVFCNSLESLRAIAGVNVVIVETSGRPASDQASFSIIWIKPPHHIPTVAHHTIDSLESPQRFLTKECLYTSLNFPPENPPPKNISPSTNTNCVTFTS